MPRKQRTSIQGTDPNYHSELPRKSEKAAAPAEVPSAQMPVSAGQKPKRRNAPDKAPSGSNTVSQSTAHTSAPPAGAEKPATREVHLTAAITRHHSVRIDALAARGIDPKVPIKLAGRKAVRLFVPKREFLEKPEADRMPMRDGYQSTKRVDVDLIDHLRAEHDPYRLSSDTAMLRGQFEPLFWDCLDKVLDELSSK